MPLTSCCHASGKGAESSTGVICRRCYREVDPRYGGAGGLHIAVAEGRSSGLTPLLVRRDLAPNPASTTSWRTVEAAVHALGEATAPVAGLSVRTWRAGIIETIDLVDSAEEVLLSPAGHFVVFRSRVHRNRPLRWYVVHAATGAHLTRLDAFHLEDSTAPKHAELDLTRDAVLDYVDALEWLPGRHGVPVDWAVEAADLLPRIGWWRDPLRHSPDRGDDDPGQAHRRCYEGWRELHRAAVLHALVADPARDAASSVVQDVVVGVLDARLPPVLDRDPTGPAVYLRRLLVQLNGGRRRDREDTRTREARREDARTAEVLTLAALHAFGDQPRMAVGMLREQASRLRAEQHWSSPADRVARLLHAALLIGELHSPVPTERQLLRHVTPGQVVVFLHSDSDLIDHPVERVVQATDPIQHLELGPANGAEQFAIPVNDLTHRPPTPAMLLIGPDTPFRLITLDRHSHHSALYAPTAAAGRWAILPADAAGMPHDALAERARAASHRATAAFAPVQTSPRHTG